MDRQRVVFAAALVRLLLGVFALAVLPVLYPGLSGYAWLFIVYMAVAAVVQVMIWKQVGGAARPIIGGVFDLVVLTVMVHLVGSVQTILVAVYFLSGTLNTLVVGRRIGMGLAILGASMYVAVVFAEALGLIPYGPARAPWITGDPTFAEAAVAAGLVSLMLIASTFVVSLLVGRIYKHENELVAANRRLEELSKHDPLTQLYNRRELLARLEMELAHVRRGRALAVVMLDLDGFKRVNDTQGHLHGDAVLKELADALLGSARVTDVTGRYGGDEFVVLLPDTDRVAAEVAATRFVETVRAVGKPSGVTASVGVAIASAEDTPRGVLQRADRGAYDAKAKGGDRLVLKEEAAE